MAMICFNVKGLYTCKNNTVRYLGFGDTIVKMNSSKTDTFIS